MFMMNGIDWSVRFVNPQSDKLRRSDGSLTCGVCDFSDRCIYLSDMLQGGFLRKVFIHEVCHSAVFSYEISMSVEQEEFLCDFVATFGDEIFEVVDSLFMALRSIA